MAWESLNAWGGELVEQLRKTVRPSIKVLTRDLPRYLAFLGPSGGGKTTSLMKLATSLKLSSKKVAIIGLDTVRLGAAEQLTQFARIMGLGLKVSETREEFRKARDLFEGAAYILIGTNL